MIPGTPVRVDACFYEGISPWMKRRHKHTGQLGELVQDLGCERFDVAVLGGVCRAIRVSALETETRPHPKSHPVRGVRRCPPRIGSDHKRSAVAPVKERRRRTWNERKCNGDNSDPGRTRPPPHHARRTRDRDRGRRHPHLVRLPAHRLRCVVAERGPVPRGAGMITTRAHMFILALMVVIGVLIGRLFQW